MLSILFGLLSALFWGAGDFTGGLASRRAPSHQVVALSWMGGLVVLPVLAILSGEPMMPLSAWIGCGIAGVVGGMGLLLLFQAMSSGAMGIAASVSAVTAAALPVIVGALTAGLPVPLTIVGFFLALVGVWLISRNSPGEKLMKTRPGDIRLPVMAGLAFGLYFILINQSSQDHLFWPMVASRSIGFLAIVVFMLATRRSWMPPRSTFPLIGLNFLLDVTGTAFYILAGQVGRMDVAVVLAAMYPGMTIFLAWLMLRERIARLQWIGISFVLVAIVLFSL